MMRACNLKFIPAAHPDIQIGGRQVPISWTRNSQEQCPENRR
jgi:hypothetical protein